MERLKQLLQAEEIRFVENESLAAHCTFKIGGPADVFARPETEEQLCRVIALCKACDVKYYLLGNGSNILFADEGFRGAVIDVSAEAAGMGLSIYQNADGDYISAPAGLKLSELCKFALQHGYTGLEFAYGIPGTVGGAVYMNAGAYGGEMKDVLESVTFLDDTLELRVLPAKDLAMGYRTSVFEQHPGWCILSATVVLHRGNGAEVLARMRELLGKRREKQPLEWHLQAPGGCLCR